MFAFVVPVLLSAQEQGYVTDMHDILSQQQNGPCFADNIYQCIY